MVGRESAPGLVRSSGFDEEGRGREEEEGKGGEGGEHPGRVRGFGRKGGGRVE